MRHKDRLNRFLDLQNKNINFADIAKELGVAQSTLRQYLNKNGYIIKEGKYTVKGEKDNNVSKQIEIKLDNKIKTNKTKTKYKKYKKDKKINITQDDMDKLCEVYDWYLQVKDLKTINKKNKNLKEDIIIELDKLEDVKSTNIKVEKNVWQEFERLCSNSEYNKQQILTQALKDFMKEYKHLL